MALNEVVHHKKCASCGRQRQTEAHQNWITQRRDFAAVLASVLDSHHRVFFEKDRARCGSERGRHSSGSGTKTGVTV
jgi:hypothetical protein